MDKTYLEEQIETISDRIRGQILSFPCGELGIIKEEDSFIVVIKQTGQQILSTRYFPIANFLCESPKLFFDLIKTFYMIKEAKDETQLQTSGGP